MGQVGIVTGATHGLGLAILRRLVAEGAYIVIADIQDNVGKALANELKVEKS
jgi:3alpha(or 20beta)-hydroxysteroid dehydrogenase